MSGEFRGRIYDSITQTIGATPLVRLTKLAADAGSKAEIVAKLEEGQVVDGVVKLSLGKKKHVLVRPA